MIKVALFVLLAVLVTVLLIGFISLMACIRLSGKISEDEVEEKNDENACRDQEWAGVLHC